MTFWQEAIALHRLAGLSADPVRKPTAESGETFAAEFRQHDFRSGVIRLEVRRNVLPSEDLLDSLGLAPASPFQNPGWLSAWRLAMKEPASVMPVTVIGYSGGVAVFALPLAVTRKLGMRVLTWYGYQLSDYCAPIIARNFAAMAGAIDGESVLARVAETIGGIDLVYLTKSPVQVGGVANPFVTAGASAYHAQAHAITLPEGESFEGFLAARRSSKTRRRIKEKLNALEKTGTVTFRFAQTVAEAREVADLCLAAKSRQLAQNGHWDPFGDPAVRGFVISSFAAEVGNTTWACSLSCGGEVLATSIGFRSGRTWLLYQMSLEDSGKERHSPGTHLLMNLLKECVAEKAQELDLALGDESYKTEWCDADRRLMITALALTPRGKMMEQALRARAGVMARLSADPKLHARAKRLQNAARKLRIPV